MSETLFELERMSDRDEVAALFVEFAAAFEENRPASVESDGSRLEIVPPPRTTVEIEVERTDEAEGSNDDGDTDLPPTIELEIELEWDETSEGPGSVRTGDAVDETVKEAADESRTTPPEPTDGDADESGGLGVGDAEDSGESQNRKSAVDSNNESGSGDSRRSRFEIYRDRSDEWRWRLVHWNGNVVADGGEGYASRHNAERAARAVMRSAPDARVERLD